MDEIPTTNQLNHSMQRSSPERLTLRKCEAARALGVSDRTLHKLLQSGQIRSFKPNRAVLIPVAEIEAFIARGIQNGGRV